MDVRLLNTLLKRMDGGAEANVAQRPHASGPERCILIFDRSGSMETNDYPPTRLLAAFDAGLEFLAARQSTGMSDLISIMLFDNDAIFVCKDISISEAAKHLLRLIIENPIDGGTDINAGLVAAEMHFKNHRQNYRNRIVLLTDGHGGNPIRTAKRLHEADVLIDVIGIAGRPEEVNEEELIKVASFINGSSHYRFIGNRTALLHHFRAIATALVRI